MRRVLLVLVAALGLVLVPLGAAETAYTDPAGDASLAPDLTTVTVDNTPDGTVTFKATVSNYTVLPSFPTALASIGLWLDLDKNPATGDEGDEAFAFFDSSGAVDLERWNGSELADVPETNMSSSFANGVLTFTIARSELLNTTGFTFDWMSLYIPGTGGLIAADSAPDFGLPDWGYDLVLPPPVVVKPVIGAASATPARPVAGKRFTVTFRVTRSDTGAPLAGASLACTTKVAGKVVPHVHAYTTGKARATLVVPKTGKGKLLTVAVKVAASGQAATKVVTYKIR